MVSRITIHLLPCSLFELIYFASFNSGALERYGSLHNKACNRNFSIFTILAYDSIVEMLLLLKLKDFLHKSRAYKHI